MLRFLFLACLVFFLGGCGKAVGGGLAAGPVTDYASLVKHLSAAGESVGFEEEVEQPFFSVKGKVLRVRDEHVQVFEYPAAAAAKAEAARVSANGMTVGTTKVHWLGPPHFYQRGKLLVLYVGDNREVQKALEAALGPQFAGQ